MRQQHSQDKGIAVTPSSAIELQKWLEDRQLYPYYAAADGTEPYDGYALRRTEGGGWVIYRCAMMTAPTEQHFNTEREAVAHYWNMLRHSGFVLPSDERE